MREFPGKVFKGKKMAGHLGNQSATVLNQRVVRIDEDKSLLYIMGNTPGAIGGVIKIRDAVKKVEKQLWDLQYPTFIPKEGEPSETVLSWDGGMIDPNEIYFHENDVVSGPVEGGD